MDTRLSLYTIENNDVDSMVKAHGNHINLSQVTDSNHMLNIDTRPPLHSAANDDNVNPMQMRFRTYMQRPDIIAKEKNVAVENDFSAITNEQTSFICMENGSFPEIMHAQPPKQPPQQPPPPVHYPHSQNITPIDENMPNPYQLPYRSYQYDQHMHQVQKYNNYRADDGIYRGHLFDGAMGRMPMQMPMLLPGPVQMPMSLPIPMSTMRMPQNNYAASPYRHFYSQNHHVIPQQMHTMPQNDHTMFPNNHGMATNNHELLHDIIAGPQNSHAQPQNIQPMECRDEPQDTERTIVEMKSADLFPSLFYDCLNRLTSSVEKVEL